MPPKFGNIRAKGRGKRDFVTYTMNGIEGQPELDVKLADVSNPKYFNAWVASRRGGVQAQELTEEEAHRLRRVDARLYAKHIVVGMRNVVDESGTPVQFSQENVLAFLRALIDGPYWEFDGLRGFVQTPQNFYEATVERDPDDEDEVVTEAAVDTQGN